MQLDFNFFPNLQEPIHSVNLFCQETPFLCNNYNFIILICILSCKLTLFNYLFAFVNYTFR